MDYRVQTIIARMKSDPARKLTLRTMSRSVNLTPEHFCRLFKAETDSTPAKYLKRLRMQKAKALLETTSLSVKEITALVGVTDESHFVRDFELLYGQTPARYRARFVAGRESAAGVVKVIKIG